MLTRLLNQPDDNQLANTLNNLLRKPETMKFDALVAFAVSSGVHVLQSELESLLARGGSVRVIVGVSNRVTTIEGLRLLLELVKKGAKVFVFHNDNATNPIFHPKLYLCQSNVGAVLIVGSNNMTGKGLVGNYEISLMQELDLKNKRDAELVTSVEGIIEKYCNIAGGFSHALDEKFLEELESEGYVGSELEATNRLETSGESDASTATPSKKKLFASKAVPQPVARIRRDRVVAAPAAGAPATTATGTLADCFWKALSWNDVNPRGSPGQIIIPIQFRHVFPPVKPTPAYAARGSGKQLECSFSVVFEDANGQTEAPDARFIIYEPLPKHPRPNPEARFTFRNRPLFDRLRQDDVLVFERLRDAKYAFRIRHVQKGTPEYARFSPGTGRQKRFGQC